LLGCKFQVVTDHKGLTWSLSVKDPKFKVNEVEITARKNMIMKFNKEQGNEIASPAPTEDLCAVEKEEFSVTCCSVRDVHLTKGQAYS
jgi:hypothetical protein